MVDQGKVNMYRYRVFITYLGKTDMRYFRSVEYLIHEFKKSKLKMNGRIEIQKLVEFQDCVIHDIVAFKDYRDTFYFIYNECPKTLEKYLNGV